MPEDVFAPVIEAILRPLLWLLLLAVVLFLLKLPAVRGAIGELAVRLIVWLRLPRRAYHSVHDLILPASDGTTQIDHVIVSRYGIFVIETKNMQGWIFGSEHQPKWTQRTRRGKYPFQNPLRQNYKHTKAIEAFLELPPEVVHSVVVFSGEATFKTAMPANVTRGSGFVSYIRGLRDVVLSEAEVADIMDRLRTCKKRQTRASRSAHVKALRDRHVDAPQSRRPGD